MVGRLKKAGIVCGLAGLLCWGIIFIADASYPDTLYEVLMPLGLLLVFLALPLFAISWILGVYRDFRAKNYSTAIITIIFGAAAVIWEVVRLLTAE